MSNNSALWQRLSLGGVLLVASLYLGCAARPGGVSPALLATFPVPPAESRAPDAAGQAIRLPKVVGFGHVDVDGGTVPLNVPVAGPIDEVLVREGERVSAGQTLLRLHAEPARLQVAQAEMALQEARIKLVQALRGPSIHDLISRQQEQAVAAADARLLGQKRQIERLDKLSQNLAVAPENFQSAQDRGLELEAALKAEKLKLDTLKLERPQEIIDLARAHHTAAELALTRAKDFLKLHALTAPEAGVILRLSVSKGQMTGPTAAPPAIWFGPERKRIIRCEIDQEFADAVRIGMDAEIGVEGPNARTWKGRVERCSDWIAGKRSLLDEPFQKNDVRTLECVVAFDSADAPTRIGQRVRVTLLDAPAAASTVARAGTRP